MTAFPSNITTSQPPPPTQFLPHATPSKHEAQMLIVQDLRTKQRYGRSTKRGVRYQFEAGQIIMKFGEQLRSSVIKEYEWSYLDYDKLKALLKFDAPKGGEKKWTEEKETAFIDALDAQLDRVYTRQKSKAGEIERRIETSRREVDDVVARLDSRGPVGRDGPVKDDDAPTEEEFMMLEQDLGDIIADVHDLAKFVQVNYTGFQKIIKKHDKKTGWILKPAFATRLKKSPFFKDNYDADIVKLSRLFDIVRTRGNPVKGDSSAGGSQGNFIRQTTKYWVHPDNITELKLLILQHLPVLVFNPNKEFEAKDSAITSIYYDNPKTWDLYEGRLKKTEGAEAIRMRWYGDVDTETIFVERKTHREDWTGEKSVKARFSLKEKFMNAYLAGKLLPEAIFEKARKEGKKPAKQIDEDERLAKEIQYSVIKHGYVPVCRSFYNRTAFQLPADARVRISLDTELTMVREDNLDGRKRAGDNWRRTDIGIDYPFSQIPPEDIERFPYAILEVKLQTQAGQEPPDWVRELIASHLVEAVPKFSKFIHGTATLFQDRIDLLPFWMPQMATDIRKPRTLNFGIQRPGGPSTQTSSSDDEDDDDDSDDDEREETASPSTTALGSNGSQSREHEIRAPGNALDIEEQIAAMPLADEDDQYYDSDDDENDSDALEEARRVGGWPYYSKLVQRHAKIAGSWLANGVHSLTNPSPIPGSSLDPLNSTRITSKRFKAPKGKKIHVPVRVEPKVYFAAERTFLSWLENSIYIGSMAALVINFGAKPTRASFLAAGTFTTVAVLALVYSLFIYIYRSWSIRNRRAARYHDKYGPTFLMGILMIALIMNFWYEAGRRGYLGNVPQWLVWW